MTELSPATQAVLHAFRNTNTMMDGPNCAAVLLAVVDWAIPMTKSPWGPTPVPVLTAEESRKRILAIAEELSKES